MHQIAQICTYIFLKKFPGVTPPDPQNWGGVKLLPRLLHIDDCPQSHFLRASAAAGRDVRRCEQLTRDCHGYKLSVSDVSATHYVVECEAVGTLTVAAYNVTLCGSESNAGLWQRSGLLL